MVATVQAIANKQVNSTESESRWLILYRIGGIAATCAVILIPIAIFVFIAWPPPTTVVGWFTLFQNNQLVALIDFDGLIVISNVLSILILLALYMALRQSDTSLVFIALALGLVGIAAYFASNPVLSMLSLSDQYTAAATEAERSLLVGAGQTMLALYQGTAFWVSNALGGAALLIFAIVMLRSAVFSKTTAQIGIVANSLGFGLFIPSGIGVLLSIISVVGLAFWFALIARRLFQLSQI